MGSESAAEPHARVADFQQRHRLALLTMLFTDMVGSTQIKQKLGDHEGMTLLARHHRLLRETLARFPEAEEAQQAGDSFFLLFTRPSDAVRFALQLQRGLRELAAETGVAMHDRIGIHVGEVIVNDDARRAIGGIQVDTCSRIMSLGGAEQTLLSRFAFDSARQALHGQDLSALGPLTWLNHGHYLFKGVDEPVEVCEVGETAGARLAAPPNTEKAHRCATPDGEPVLGWRPAVGQQVPGTSWILERNLGAGGFGEVWLGQHSVLKQRRVFKFCFRADHARSLKREVTIFRLLRERVGEHPHIVTVHDVYFDEPPFYLVMDYVEGAALPAWAEAQGGLIALPLPVRLEIVAQVADALATAHGAGVIHRDVKPSNILLGGTAETPQVKLTDFGIGQVLSAEVLGGITQLGFTQTLLGTDSYSGTQLYLSPELLTGRIATQASDIYSLGVVLFQMIAGDFARPLTTDWADAIDAPLLREDLRRCFASDPQKRFAGAAELATRLRTLPQRQAARDAEEARRANAERLAYRRGLVRAAAVALIVVGLIASLALVAWSQAKRARGSAGVATHERDRSERMLTRLELQRADELLAAHDTPAGLAYLARVVRRDPQHRVAAERLLSTLRDRSHALPLTDRLMHEKMVLDVAFSPDGRRVAVTTADSTRIWDAASGKLLGGPLPFGGFRVLFTPDGERLIVMKFDGRLVDAATGKALAEFDANPNASGGEARPDAMLSPDGEILLTISARPEVRLWNARTGAPLGVPFVHSDEVWCARISSDGRQIVTGSKDGKSSLWDAQSGALRQTWETGSRVVRVAFSPDGTRIGAGLLDGRVILWDPVSGAEIGGGKHDEEVTDLSFSPDGTVLFSTSHDGSARFWKAATGEPHNALPRTRYRMLGGGFSPDGLRLLTRTAEGVVFVHAAHNLEFVVEPIRPGAIPLVATFSPDGTTVATGGADGSVRLWHGQPAAAEPLHLWHGARVMDAATDGFKNAATAGADGKVRLWDLTTARSRGSLAHGGSVALVRLSPQAETWLTAGSDGSVRHWDAATGQPRGSTIQLPGRPVAAAFARDGRTFLLASEGHRARIWDASTLQPLTPEFGSKTREGVLTGDGRTVVLAQGEDAGVWDARTGERMGVPVAHKAQVDCLAISEDARRFSTGSRDGSARLWELATGKPIGAEMKHGNVVRTLSFSPDHERLVSTSYDRLARLWDVATGTPRGAALAHPEVALSAIFVDRDRVLTGSSDGFARLWDADSGVLLAEPQRIVGPVRHLSVAIGGLRALAIGEAEHKATLLELARAPLPAPAWLADWAEAVGGQRLADSGALEVVPFAALAAIRQRIAALEATEEFTTTAHWFFEPLMQRTVSPFSKLRLVEYALALGEAGPPDAARYGLHLAPQSAQAWAAVALRRMEQETPLDGSELTAVDWAIRRALLLDANEPRAWLARGLILEQRGELKSAATALDRAAALQGPTPSELLRRARTRVLTGSGSAAEAAPENLALRGIPARDPQATDRQIDLSAYYNCRLDEDPIPGDEGNTLEELPRGLQTLAGVTWDLRGLVQLRNRDRLQRFPTAVRGIAIGATCVVLHFLHAAEFVQAAAGTEVARYVIRYEDGGQVEVPLRNGRELGDWWGEPLPPLEAAWRGANRLTRAKHSRLNLFKTTWTNPRPDAVVTALDFISAQTAAAPFVVAISRE